MRRRRAKRFGFTVLEAAAAAATAALLAVFVATGIAAMRAADRAAWEEAVALQGLANAAECVRAADSEFIEGDFDWFSPPLTGVELPSLDVNAVVISNDELEIADALRVDVSFAWRPLGVRPLRTLRLSVYRAIDREDAP